MNIIIQNSKKKLIIMFSQIKFLQILIHTSCHSVINSLKFENLKFVKYSNSSSNCKFNGQWFFFFKIANKNKHLKLKLTNFIIEKSCMIILTDM